MDFKNYLKIRLKGKNGLMMPAFYLDLDRENLSWVDREEMEVDCEIINHGDEE